MPIKKRKIDTTAQPDQTLASGCGSYHEYRAMWWRLLDRTNFNFHGSRFEFEGQVRELRDNEFMLQPKPVLLFKDIWHCGSTRMARQLAREILKFDDVLLLELKRKWVWVDYDTTGKHFELPDQPVDPRRKYYG